MTDPPGPPDPTRWTTGEKHGFGTVADHGDPDPTTVWFTLTAGSLTELRYPRVDVANLRTLEFLVTDPEAGYAVRTHRDPGHGAGDGPERRVEPTSDRALAFRNVVEERGSAGGREWTLAAEYAVDSGGQALLTDVEFRARDGREYEVLVVADLALGNVGGGDAGTLSGGDGQYRLAATPSGSAAERFPAEDDDDPPLVDVGGDPFEPALAVAADGGFEWASVEVAGAARVRDLFRDGTRSPPVERAAGNLVLVGLVGTGSRVDRTLSVGFADADPDEALAVAAESLDRGFESVREEYVDSWRSYLADRPVPDCVRDDPELLAQYRFAVMVLRAAEDKTVHGAGVASPSVPWGETVVADEATAYGYNFVWTRDLYQAFTASLAVGDADGGHDALAYVYERQQEADGFLPQNTSVDGRPRWDGEQLDNVAFPAVMADQLARRGLSVEAADYSYDDVALSTDYVAFNGPDSEQERWEEEAGYSPSTIAAGIAGLACAASVALDRDERADALAWLATADDWAARVDDWTVTTTGTDELAPPYFLRITGAGDPDRGAERSLANHGPTLDERAIVDAGFLELVRLGIREPDDDVVERSLAVVDREIRVDTPYGPGFYRYVGDGYGERQREDPGGPWTVDHGGKGRLWPILTGERAEYELAAGTRSGELAPERLLETMAGFANDGRMIPEQVWDREDGTPYGWEFGKGTGSATPLCWSMAGFVRLAHGIDAGRPVETPAVLRERYPVADRPDGPALSVDLSREGDEVVASVDTDGAAVAVKTRSDAAYVEPDAERVTVRVETGGSDPWVVVAAAGGTDLRRHGTTVVHRTP